MERVAVIGDIGGHAEELYAALVGLGADPDDLTLPADLVVIQVGDLIHRGPDSTGVLDIVERQLPTGRWVQLLGNHEANEVEAPLFRFETVSPSDRARLIHWRAQGQIHAAAALDTPGGEVLVTHAGLTSGFYADLRRPTGAAATAEKLDELGRGKQGFYTLNRAGMMLHRHPNHAAGPIWAQAGHELCASWLHEELPFDQVHGHSSMYHWTKKTFAAPPEVAAATTVDPQTRQVCTRFPSGRRIWGVDPCLGAYGGARWSPLVLDAQVTYPTR